MLASKFFFMFCPEGQLISKANCHALNSSKKRTNEFIFTTMQPVFIHFLEEIEDTKKTFRNYLTFNTSESIYIIHITLLKKVFLFCLFTVSPSRALGRISGKWPKITEITRKQTRRFGKQWRHRHWFCLGWFSLQWMGTNQNQIQIRTFPPVAPCRRNFRSVHS